MAGHHGYHHAGENPAGHDLEQHVGKCVGCVVDVPETGVADRLGKHERTTEPDEARREGEGRDGERDRAPATNPGRRLGPAHSAGSATSVRRPSPSTRRRTGLRSMTLVKLTRSLINVMVAIVASSAARATPGRPAAATTPTPAPRAFAPQSPSMDRSPRSAGSEPSAAPRTGADPGPHSMAPATTTTLAARPGRRSNRLVRFAAPAISAPSSTRSVTRTQPANLPLVSPSLVGPPLVGPRLVVGPLLVSMAPASKALRPTPTTLTIPLVTLPSRSAR